YVAGTLDIHAMHRSVIAPMARFEPEPLRRWRDAFALALRSRFSPALRARVEEHRARGDLCAIVTATSRLVAEPFAQALALDHLVATEPVLVDGRPNGEIAGLPCFREHKVTRVNAWLAGEALPPLCWLLFLANVLFSVIYDTEYAMVDRDEDIEAGARSTAILFGDADRPILGVLMGTFLLAMLLVGTRAGLHWPYFVAIALAAALFARQQWTLRDRAREHCFAAFRQNNAVGGVLWVGMALALALR
ncbi:MAG TPA: haloacid dehalogenase-like hydrolase, partial [Rhodanobacteraceae bacterium]|nr:haloacid dehalogenase-like hydrolase [Rhodanobacteraceae bacterium]